MATKKNLQTKFLLPALCESLLVVYAALVIVVLTFYIAGSYSDKDIFSVIRETVSIMASIAIAPYTPGGYVPPTGIRDVVFSLVSGVDAWKEKKHFINTWWRPNVTRGYLYFDKPQIDEFIPWPPTSPPYRVSQNTSDLEKHHVAPIMVRMVMSILDVFQEGDENVKWYIIGFDDSVFFVDNWVDVLAKYDHTKYINIGAPSESSLSNFHYSYEMGFGGGGIALSYPLAAAMVKQLKGCIKRYPYVKSADLITQYCVDEFGVPLTVEKGIHQIDLRGDISGFLSSHPQTPLLSLHHLDIVDPIFPSKDTFQSINHLMKAADFDQSRLLQQTICYHKPKNMTFSVSWGYTVHIYDKIHPRHYLKRPLETFGPWKNTKAPAFMFNTRKPCESIPNVLFFESIEKSSKDQIVTTYIRPTPAWEPKAKCQTGNRSVDSFSRVRVFSSVKKVKEIKIRSECGEIVSMNDSSGTVDLQLRVCKEDEIVA